MSKQKRRLLQKYEIPVNNLDFNYIKSCKNVREMEKILQILYSGEEGYYEELTKCAEEQLKILNPNSKCFRYERKILTRHGVNKSEWDKDREPVLEWSDEVKVKDNFLSVIANEKDPELNLPKIRGKNEKISYTKKEENKNESDGNNKTNDNNNIKNNNSQRIKSTDYERWDKYDAETECLKMELNDERLNEENEIKKLKETKEMGKEMIIPVNENNEIINKLTNIEKEALSMKHKDRGNDYFRVKEYKNALFEYTKCIEIFPTATVYNNRAITYMKLSLYKKALEDLDKCLEIEPKNIKALLRQAQSLVGMDKRRDAYTVYTKIISIEPSNIAARTGLNDLKKQLPDLPPATATRIVIKENEENLNEYTNKNHKSNENLNSSKEIIKKENSNKNICEFINAITKEDNKKIENNFENIKTKVNVNKFELKTNENLKLKNNKNKNETEKMNSIKSATNANQLENIENINDKNQGKLKASDIHKTAQKTNEGKEFSKNSNIEYKNSKKKNRNTENDYVQEDLSKLIIPKKIIKSKLAKTLDVLKNNTVSKSEQSNNKNKLEKNSALSKNQISPKNLGPAIKLLPDKPKNGILIKEIK